MRAGSEVKSLGRVDSDLDCGPPVSKINGNFRGKLHRWGARAQILCPLYSALQMDNSTVIGTCTAPTA